MPEGMLCKKYTPGFKKPVVEPTQKEKQIDKETERRERGGKENPGEHEPEKSSGQCSDRNLLLIAQKRTAVSAEFCIHGTLQAGMDAFWSTATTEQLQKHGKAEGLATCNSQTTSPFSRLNNVYLKIVSGFWGHCTCGAVPFSCCQSC